MRGDSYEYLNHGRNVVFIVAARKVSTILSFAESRFQNFVKAWELSLNSTIKQAPNLPFMRLPNRELMMVHVMTLK